MALKGLNANVKITGTPTAFTGEATTSSGPNLVYQITNAAKRILSDSATITVEDGGVTTVETYTINRLTGTVTFGSAVARVITIDGTYLPVATLGESKNFAYKLGANNIDTTKFADTFVRRRQGLKDASGSVAGFLVDTTYATLLQAGNPIVLDFYYQPSAPDIRIRALLSADSITAAVAGVIDDQLDWQSVSDADGNCVALTGL